MPLVSSTARPKRGKPSDGHVPAKVAVPEPEAQPHHHGHAAPVVQGDTAQYRQSHGSH